MRKLILLFAATIISSLVYSQEVRSFSQEDLARSPLKLAPDWKFEINNQKVMIKNGRISNSSSQHSGKMLLELYFSTNPVELTLEKIEGYAVSSFELNGTNGNSSLTSINIEFVDQNLPPNGKYYPVLLLTQSGKVRDVFQINHLVRVEDKYMSILKENEYITDTSGVTNPNDSLQMIVMNDNSLAFEAEWKIEVDFKNFIISLDGGDIRNTSAQDVEKLKIDIFLTKEKQSEISQNFDGLLIGSVPFDSPLKAGVTAKDITVKTNLRAIPLSGPQYILLTVSEVDDEGNTYLKSFRAFDNPVTPYE